MPSEPMLAEDGSGQTQMIGLEDEDVNDGSECFFSFFSPLKLQTLGFLEKAASGPHTHTHTNNNTNTRTRTHTHTHTHTHARTRTLKKKKFTDPN